MTSLTTRGMNLTLLKENKRVKRSPCIFQTALFADNSGCIGLPEFFLFRCSMNRHLKILPPFGKDAIRHRKINKKYFIYYRIFADFF